MLQSFMFWLMKPLAELAWALAVLGFVMAVYGLYQLPGAIRQWRCKHARAFENGRCDAICYDCHKNLGFIGTWRDKQKGNSQ